MVSNATSYQTYATYISCSNIKSFFFNTKKDQNLYNSKITHNIFVIFIQYHPIYF
jgi:hypothetical protein